jgi:hypothetical protein
VHLLVTLLAWVPLNQEAPTAALLVAGQTRRVMAANLAAGSGILLALLLLPLLPHVETVLACVLVGRLVSLAVFLRAARAAAAKASWAMLKPLAWSLLPVAAAALVIAVAPPEAQWWRAAVVAAALLVILPPMRRAFVAIDARCPDNASR